MKHAPTLASILLGLAFITFGANFFLNFIPMPADPSPADAPHKLFMAAMFPTGYLAFVKVLEILIVRDPYSAVSVMRVKRSRGYRSACQNTTASS